MIRSLLRYPFEFFAAFMVFILGLYGLINPDWPPYDTDSWKAIILNMEAVYLVVSGGAVMGTFFFRQKCPVGIIVVQMFSWLFIGFAALMAILIQTFISDAELVKNPDSLLSFITIIIWFALMGASFTKFFDIRIWYKSGGFNK